MAGGCLVTTIGFVLFILLIPFLDSPEKINSKPQRGTSFSTPAPSTTITRTATENNPPLVRNNNYNYDHLQDCLSWLIRINTMKSIVIDSASVAKHVNNYVNDYNTECSKSHYANDIIQTIRKQVEPDRWKIENEARNMVEGWRKAARQTKIKKRNPRQTQPNQLVSDIQKRLTEHGYKPGIVDGLLGRKTVQAIKEFQSDKGVFVNGNVSNELLQKLNRHKPTPQPTHTTSTAPITTTRKLDKESSTLVLNKQKISLADTKKITDYCKTTNNPDNCVDYESNLLLNNPRVNYDKISISDKKRIENFCYKINATPGSRNRCVHGLIRKL